MEAERLGGGGVDDLPDVEVHAQAEHLEFVDQRDVDAAIDILEQLGHLRGGGRGDGNGAAEDGAVERGGDFAGLGIESANHLRNIVTSHLGVAGILALGRKRDPDIVVAGCAFAGSFQAGLVFLFENRNQDFFGGAGVGRALEDDDLAGAQIGRDGVSGVGDVAEVGLVILVERRGDADDDRIHGGDLRIVGRGFKAVRFGRRDLRRRDAENVGAAAGQGVDFSLIDIETGDGKFLLAVEQGQRQSDVAEADDSDPCLAGIDAAFQVSEEGRSGELSIHRPEIILALEIALGPRKLRLSNHFHAIVTGRLRS